MKGSVQKRYPFVFGVCSFLTIGSMIAYSMVPFWSANAYVGADFTVANGGNATVGSSAANVRVMTLDLPAPAADSIVHNGAGVTVAGDQLVVFSNMTRSLDDSATDNNTYDDGEAIVYDADNNGNISNGDQVVSAGKADLTNFVIGDNVYFDNSSGDNDYSQGVDHLFKDFDADAVYTQFADTLVDGDGSVSSGIGTVDPSAAAGDPLTPMGDNIAHGGFAVCASSLGEYYVYAMRIDTDGDCTNGTLTEGTYIIGSGEPIDVEVTSAFAFGDAVTMGGNGDGDYDDGEDIFLEDTVGKLTYSAAPDDLLFTGSGTLSKGDAGMQINLDQEVIYLDSNHNGTFEYRDPMADLGDGNTLADDADLPVTATLMSSAQNVLVPDWKRMDQIANLRFRDNSSDGLYSDGEDIIADSDQSGYFDADILSHIAITNSGTCTNSAINRMSIWEDTDGSNTFNAGIDTLIGQNPSLWAFSSITTSSASAYTAVSDNRTIFVAINGISSYNLSCTVNARVAQNDARFHSEVNSPTDAAVTTTDVITIDGVPPTISAVREFDVDGNGNIDETMITYSKPISDTSVTPGNFKIGASFADNFLGILSINGVDPNIADDNIITIKKDAEVGGTGAKALEYVPGTLTDLLGNAQVFVNIPTNSVIDSAVPLVLSKKFVDDSSDGSVDSVYFSFSEPMTWNGLDMNQFNVVANGLTGFQGNPSSWAGDTDPYMYLYFAQTTTDLTGTSGVQPTIAYAPSGTDANRIKDMSGNNLAGFGATALDDGALPILLSVTPAADAVNVLLTTDLVYNFSETMTPVFNVGGQFDVSPDSGGWADVWSNGDKTVTLSHLNYINDTQYSVTTTEGSVNDLNSNPLYNSGDWSFSTPSSGRLGGGGGGSATPSVSFTINNGATETSDGSVTLNISPANATEMIVANEPNFQTVKWEPLSSLAIWPLPVGLGTKIIFMAVRNANQTVSTVVSQSIKVVEKSFVSTIDVDNSTITADKTAAKADGAEKIIATVAVRLNDGKAAVGKTVLFESSRKVEDTVSAINAITDASGIAKFEITSANEGVSILRATVDGFSFTKTVPVQFTKIAVNPDQVNLIALSVGDLVKSSANGAAVYYYGIDGKRHSFASQTIYNTYYTDFSGIKDISSEQMAGIELGANAKARPGTWLIKVTTDPKVYAVTPDGVLRWVTTEAIAKALYGTTWNKKIIDVDAAFFNDYTKGLAIEKPVHPNASLIQYSGDTTVYYILNGVKRKVADTAVFNANRFQDKFKQVVSTSLIYGNGTDITGREDAISQVVY
jgi:hypothetical protein